MIVPPIQIEGYTINIVLPHAYHKSGVDYPVVYVQDGGDVVMDCYNQLDHLVRSNQIAGCIYVGIEPIDRNLDYTPWPATGLANGKPVFGGEAHRYLQFLVSIVKPFIDNNYRTKPGVQYTTIAGSSLGALVSLFASYWFPTTFGNYILLSASLWYEGVLEFLQRETYKVNRGNQKMYMYVGELEGIYHTTLQKNMVTCSKATADLLKGENFASFEFEVNDSHFFAIYFTEAIKKLFPSK